MMSRNKKIILIIAFVLLFFASVCVVAYPLVSNLQAEKQKDAIVLAYREAVEYDAGISDELAAARAYNAALANGQETEADYDALLNPDDTGMMGIVTIPTIGVELPIYHGTQSLSLGAVHLQGTSLPVGGENTHAVISAHSGMTSQKMFTDLDRLEVGDVFYLILLFHEKSTTFHGIFLHHSAQKNVSCEFLRPVGLSKADICNARF